MEGCLILLAKVRMERGVGSLATRTRRMGDKQIRRSGCPTFVDLNVSCGVTEARAASRRGGIFVKACGFRGGQTPV